MAGENDLNTGSSEQSWYLSCPLRQESDFGLFRSTPEGRFLEVSPRLVQLLGYASAEELKAVDLSRDVYADPNARVQLASEVQSHIKIAEVVWKRKDGSFLIARISAYAIRDEQNRIVAFEGYVEDITEQKQMDELLRHTNQELQAIYDGIVDGILLTDIETRRFVRANSAISRMLGYSQNELLSLGVADICLAHQTHRAVSNFDAMARGERTSLADARCRCKDGSEIFFDVTCSPVIYRGRPCLVCFFHDTSERREKEAALRLQRSVLQQLLEMHEQERQLIAYEIHDGLTQELAGAILQIQAYSRHLQEKPDEAKKEFDRALELLGESMAEARRLISGLRPPILDESGVVAAIEHLVWDSRAQTDADIEFHADVEFERLPPPLESAVYRIVHEGLTNALRHSKSDRLVITLLQQGGQLHLEVRDWGIGFDPEGTTEGRGLQSVVQRVRIFGGQLDLHSNPGTGTRLSVRLPLVEPLSCPDDAMA